MKKLLFVLLFFTLLLTACGGQADEVEEPAGETEPKTEADPTDTPETTQAEAPTATVAQAQIDDGEAATVAQCSPDPIPVSQNPDVARLTIDDWQHGNPEANLVIVEYGDFQ